MFELGIKKKTLNEDLPCTKHYAKHFKENYLLYSL